MEIAYHFRLFYLVHCIWLAEIAGFWSISCPHIKGRLKVLQANKTSTKDEEERRAFFEKYSGGFQRNLKNLLLCCVSACALDARNGRAFSLLLQVLSLRAESVPLFRPC